jgi:hypothetical protein
MRDLRIVFVHFSRAITRCSRRRCSVASLHGQWPHELRHFGNEPGHPNRSGRIRERNSATPCSAHGFHWSCDEGFRLRRSARLWRRLGSRSMGTARSEFRFGPVSKAAPRSAFKAPKKFSSFDLNRMNTDSQGRRSGQLARVNLQTPLKIPRPRTAVESSIPESLQPGR